MSLDVLPDTRVLVRGYLLTVPEITAHFTGGIHTTLPGSPTYPCLTLQRIGGTSGFPERLDTARIDFSSWAKTEIEASLGIRLLRAALAKCGNYRTTAGVLCGARDIAGAQWRPDTTATPPLPRFLSTLDITARTP